MTERQRAGDPGSTSFRTALDRLRELVDRVERTERLPVTNAVGRVLAEDVVAQRPVPHRDHATADGYAVRATDTAGAATETPVDLRADARVTDRTAVRVDAGDELPAGADAVVDSGDATRRDDGVSVTAAVAPGENVARTGADVEAGATVFRAGRRIRRADSSVSSAVGRARVPVYERPTVGVVPTGDEVVDGAPDPGDVVETSGRTVASYVAQWGGKPTYRNPVDDDPHALRAALQRDLTKDVVVTTGGTGAGERDLVPDIVDDIGEMRVRGVALTPGGSTGFGLVRETPVLTLPGDPVASLVAAFQFLRPVVRLAGHLPSETHPTTAARLDRRIEGGDGVRTCVPVTLDRFGGGGNRPLSATERSEAETDETPESATTPTATPVESGPAERLSTVARADGWVVVPASRERIPAGETVTVEDWEFQP